MTTPTTTRPLAGRLTRVAGQIGDQYSRGTGQPLRGYVTTMAAYTAVIGALSGAAAASGREIPQDGPSPFDVLLLSAATYKISRLLTKDPVTSPLRAPFTAYAGPGGPGELSEEVRIGGEGQAIGELVTSPFSASVWVATGLTAGLVFLPGLTRLVTGTFAALAGTDLLHFGHDWLARVAS
ncbi:MAG TPA: DUF1360 domain-containing protein [Streptosporangiaceae bacterium]|nr:DUF1360 domain-containing protein [Streptosporangiaceae bacterium]